MRSTIHQILTDESKSDRHEFAAGLTKRAILAFRISAYLTPYLTEHPSIDRFSETVERLREDHFSKAFPPIAVRKAIVDIREPLDVSEYMQQAGGKLRDAVGALTADMENSVQSGIDGINDGNSEKGAELVNSEQ